MSCTWSARFPLGTGTCGRHCSWLQEATLANLVRAYVRIKTHPTARRLVLTGQRLAERKDGYADWQLLEEQA